MSMTPLTTPVSELYLIDETAWLESMATLVVDRDIGSIDWTNLAEYLSDMARRDKREVQQRLAVLLAHLLKWQAQPNNRSRSWRLTIDEQREELQDLLESGTLRNHAEVELANVYRKAVRRAAVETELEEASFPAECPFTLEDVLTGPV